MAPPPPPPPPGTATGSSGSSSNPTSSSSIPVPKILLAKPPSSSESNAAHRRPPLGSLNILSDTWDLLPDRVLPFLTENTDFTVIGVIGPTGVGKSTILNAIYDGNQQSGMLPPFPVQTEETRALARHCSVGLELRVSHERLILLDTQPMFSTSILMDMMRPDGTSTVSLNNSEALSADLVHEMMCIQIGVFLASICHVLLVVSEGVHDVSMWKLMTTVDLLKHGIPDPSSLTPSYSQGSNMGSEKENKDILQDACVEYLAAPVFVHTKLREQDPSPRNTIRMKKMLSEYFRSSSFAGTNYGDINRVQICSASKMNDSSSSGLKLFLLPNKSQDDSQRAQYESYATSLGKLRDQVLSMNCQPFSKPVSEREWLRNSARVWDTVKNSPVIAEYCKMLQNSEPVFTSEDENSDIESQIPEISQSVEDHSKEKNPNVKAEVVVPQFQGSIKISDIKSQIPEISQSRKDHPKEENPNFKIRTVRRRWCSKNPDSVEDHSKEENPNVKAEEVVPQFQGGIRISDIKSQIPEISQSLKDHPKEENPNFKIRTVRRRWCSKNPDSVEDHSKEENPNVKAEEVVPQFQGGIRISDIKSQIPEISQSLKDHPKEENPNFKIRTVRKQWCRKNPDPKDAAVPVPTLLKRDHSKELTEEEVEWLKDKELAGSQKKTPRRRYSEMSFKDLYHS